MFHPGRAHIDYWLKSMWNTPSAPRIQIGNDHDPFQAPRNHAPTSHVNPLDVPNEHLIRYDVALKLGIIVSVGTPNSYVNMNIMAVEAGLHSCHAVSSVSFKSHFNCL